MLLEPINGTESFAYSWSSLSPVKITGRESGEHLQESANETAKSFMTGSLIKGGSFILVGHSSLPLGSIENLI